MSTAVSPLRFEELAGGLAAEGGGLGAGDTPPGFAALRARARARFAALGLPTTRQEAWRFTDLSPLARTRFARPSPETEGSLRLESLEARLHDAAGGLRIVFVDGRLSRPLSRLPERLPEGLTLGWLAEAAEDREAADLGRLADPEGDPFVALNTACWSDGALLAVRAGAALPDPIHLVFVATAGEAAITSHPRVLLKLGRSAEATVIESYIGAGEGRSFTNAVSEAFLEENSVLSHYRVQREGEEAFHLGRLAVRQERSSSFRSFAFAAGGRLSRVEIETAFLGEGAGCVLHGLYLGHGRQLLDHQTSIDHAAPHGTSQELYKGILDGRARAVFNGRIVVRPDAQKTDAQQKNKNLILSDETTINSKPQLEIFANDVKCAHGATVGQLDADSLFYLRTRGIAADRARRLLTYAFAAEMVESIAVLPLRDFLFRSLFSDLPDLAELREHA
jgi:Fe-S cluster assembly protein SufD